MPLDKFNKVLNIGDWCFVFPKTQKYKERYEGKIGKIVRFAPNLVTVKFLCDSEACQWYNPQVQKIEDEEAMIYILENE